MPITPRFSLSQTASTLVVTIRVPHVRVSVSAVEVVVDGKDFHFYSPPYLLRLTFPSNLVDDAESGREAKAVFDPSKDDGTLTVTAHKEEEAIWEDLDLLGKLMQTSASSEGSMGKNTISVLSSTDNEDVVEEMRSGTVSGGDAAGTPPNPGNEETDIASALKPHYGFLSSFHSVFAAYGRNGLSEDCVELPDPDETASEERRSLRLDAEGDKFDEERYLGDVFLGEEEDEDNDGGDMIYEEAVRMVPIWQKNSSIDEITQGIGKLNTDDNACSVNQGGCATEGDAFFSSEETHLLATISTAILPTKHPIESAQCDSLLLGLTDLLFGYAYDHRTTFGDPTVESQWTCPILSPTLSWFEQYNAPYDSLQDVLRWCMRRSLIYPYIRSYSFARLIAADVAAIMLSGRRMILRCLLQLHQILHKSEGRYLLCKLYLDPYIVWVQAGLEDKILLSFAKRIVAMVKESKGDGNEVLGKASLGLGLVELERAALYDEDASDSSSSEEGSSSDEDSGGDSSEESGLNSVDEGHSGNHVPSNSSASERQANPQRSSALMDEHIGSSILASIPIAEVLEDVTQEGSNADSVEKEESGQGEKKLLIEEI